MYVVYIYIAIGRVYRSPSSFSFVVVASTIHLSFISW